MDYKIKTIISKRRYLLYFISFSFFILLAFILWKVATEKRERLHVNQLVSGTSRNLNLLATTKVLNALKGKDDFRFAVMGDCRDNLKQFKKTLEAAARDKPDFIINTGDLTDSGKYYQYMDLLDSIKGFEIPIISIMGNHDRYNGGVKCFLHVFGPFDFYFDINSYRFIFVNNTLKQPDPTFVRFPGDANTMDTVAEGINEYQIREIEKLIQGAKHNFIVMHLPPPLEPFRGYEFYKNGDTFISLMKSHAQHISLVLCGHIHGFGETEVDGVRYVVSGGAGASLHWGGKGIVSKFNYVLVNVAKNTVTYQVKFLD